MYAITHHSISPGSDIEIIKYTYKKTHDFYKVLAFKWYMSKFEPNQIISLQITVI